MDEKYLEQASELTELFISASISKALATKVTMPVGFDGHCVDCGEPIPPLRLKLGVITCLSCQELRERTPLSARSVR